jgi:hypothetical protein
MLGKGKGRARDTAAAAAAAASSVPVAVQPSHSIDDSSGTETDSVDNHRVAKKARTATSASDKAVKHSAELTVTIAAFRHRLPTNLNNLQHLDLGSLIANIGIDEQGKAISAAVQSRQRYLIAFLT